MRKEIKKNNKMLLALVVVAALAMVSVTAVVVSDSESDAATSRIVMWSADSTVIGNLEINKDGNGINYQLVVNEATLPSAANALYLVPIIITDDAEYTGEITIGTLSGTTFTPMAKMSLDEVSAAYMTALVFWDFTTTECVALFMVGNNEDTDPATEGTFQLLSGEVMTGNAIEGFDWNASGIENVYDLLLYIYNNPTDFTAFTGELLAGDFSVVSDNVNGLILAIDGTDVLLSGWAEGQGGTGSLILDGPATVQYSTTTADAMSGGAYAYTFLTRNADVTIEEDAVITIGTAAGGETSYGVSDNPFNSSLYIIKGEIDVFWFDASNYGVLNIRDNETTVEFEGTGMIAYEIDGTIALATPPAVTSIIDPITGNPAMASPNMGAAYFVEKGSATVPTTYYFTTLENAIALGANPIYITGLYIIKEDLTLPSPIEIIIMGTGTLQVGTGAADNAPVFTIEKGAKVTNGLGGTYIVKSGQAKYIADDPTTFVPPYEPISAVKFTTATAVIYTDIATALKLAEADPAANVITLRPSPAPGAMHELLSDATLAPEDTLVNVAAPNGAGLIVMADRILTVKGTLDLSNYATENYGTIRIANGGVAEIADLINDGTLEVQTGGTLTLSGAVTTAGTGVLKILGGKVTIDANAAFATITMTGAAELEIKSGTTETVDITVGTAPTVSYENANPAKITGTIELANLATIYGDSTITKANFTGTQVVSTQFLINGKVFQTLITGDINLQSLLPIIYPDLLDVIVHDWNNDAGLNGVWLSYYLPTPGAAPDVGSSPANDGFATDWTMVYAKWTPRMYDVTFGHAVGITWTVGVNGAANTEVSTNPLSVAYNTKIKVDAVVNAGYEGTPQILRGTSPYTAMTEVTVTSNMSFTVVKGSVTPVEPAKDKGTGWGDPIIILLIIIIIIIAIIAIVVAAKLLRS